MSLARKYAPARLDDIIGHDECTRFIRASTRKGDLPHIILQGGSGVGKTAMSLAVIRELYDPNDVLANVLRVDASRENGIQVVRNEILGFSRALPLGRKGALAFKLVVVDGVGLMTSEAQTALKKVMEETCRVTRFLLVKSSRSGLIEAIASRCVRFELFLSDMDVFDIVNKVSTGEGMGHPECVVDEVSKVANGDARVAINLLQVLPRGGGHAATLGALRTLAWDGLDASVLDNVSSLGPKGTLDLVRDVVCSGVLATDVARLALRKSLAVRRDDDEVSKFVLYVSSVVRALSEGGNQETQLLALLTNLRLVLSGGRVIDPEYY